MKLAIVTHTVVKGDGQGRVNYELATAASSRGHQVLLLANRADPDLTSRRGVTFNRLKTDGWPTALVSEQVFAWRSTQQLRRHRNALDLIVVNGFNTWEPADVNVVHFVHGSARRALAHMSYGYGPYAWYQWLYSGLNAYWERGAFRRAKTMVAVSEKIRDELVRIGVSQESIRVIHNGVDTEEFQPRTVSRNSLCIALGFLDSGLKVFGSTLPRPARRDRVARGLDFDSRTSQASTARCTSA